jgi:hypothetical protein
MLTPESGVLGFDPRTQLITPDTRYIFATPFDEQTLVQRPDVAVISTWTELEALGTVNVQSMCVNPVFGVAYVLFGLATRPLIGNLLVVGKNIVDQNSGGSAFLRLAAIKAQALQSANYTQTFLELAAQEPILKGLIDLLTTQGWWHRVPEILRDVDIHNHWGVTDLDEIQDLVNSTPPKNVLTRQPEFMPMPKESDRPEPMPMFVASELIEQREPNLLNLWRLGLQRIIDTGFERNGTVESNIEFGMPWMNPDEISESDLAEMGLDRQKLLEKYSLMIPFRKLDIDQHLNPEKAAYLYVVSIFGIETFPELLEDPDSNPEALKWLDLRYEGKLPANHFQRAIEKLVKDPLDRSAVISVFDNNTHGNLASPPCLTQIHLMSDPETGKLDLMAVVRSHDIYGAWPSNMLGLMKLLQIACEDINHLIGRGVVPGKIQIWSQSAHFYKKNESDAKVQAEKAKLPFEWDPRGNFVDSFDVNTGILTLTLNWKKDDREFQRPVYRGRLNNEAGINRAMRAVTSFTRHPGNIAHMAQVIGKCFSDYQLAQVSKSMFGSETTSSD